jgi:hypothetical protein
VRLTRRGRLSLTLSVAILCIVAGATYAFSRTSPGSALSVSPAPTCHLAVNDTTLSWSPERAMAATTIAAVGQRIGATDNGIAAAVSRGLRGRDRVIDAGQARTIYRKLPHRATPSAASRAVADAIMGASGPALTCTASVRPASLLRAESLGASGLTPRAQTVQAAMRRAFGRQPLGGFAPGGVASGHVAGSAHYEGRAIDVFFRPISAANRRLGWQQAQWAVAHAGQLQVATVIFDRHIWSAERSSSGWRDYVYPDGPTDNPILLHEDHVHVDVQRGLAT